MSDSHHTLGAHEPAAMLAGMDDPMLVPAEAVGRSGVAWDDDGATPAQRIAGDRRFFGHPLGLATLFGTELWERFSYYGMRAILLYYITDTVANHGLGIAPGIGTALVSIYGAGVYLLSIVGGWLSDRVLGAYLSTFIGGLIIAAGHVFLALPQVALSWIGICLIALGTGLLKPNVSSMVGELYDRKDARRHSAFSIFYMGINIGSLLSPIIVGLVRNRWGYHGGFLVAAIGMGLALISFVVGRKLLGGAGNDVPNPIQPAERGQVLKLFLGVIGFVALLYLAVLAHDHGVLLTAVIDSISYLSILVPIAFFAVMLTSKKVTKPERRRLRAYVPLFLAAMAFFMIFEQAATTLSAYAANNTNLNFLWFRNINPESFQTINPLFIIVLTPLFATLWLRLGGRFALPYKFASGLALAALSFLFLAAAAWLAHGHQTAAWVLGLVYIIQTLGELMISPVGLAATTLMAPQAFRGQAMALWFLAASAGQAITAQLVQFTDGMAPAPFFGGIGLVALALAGVIALLGKRVQRHIDEADQDELADLAH